MPALTSKRASAALRGIRREFDRRRMLAAVANGRIVKTYSALSPIPNAPAGPVQKSPVPVPRKPAAAAIKRPTPRAPAIAYMELGEAPQRCTAPKGRPTPFGIASGGIQTSPAPVRHDPAIENLSLPVRNKPAGAGTRKSYAPPLPPPRSASAPISPATPPLSAASKTIKKGSTVLVRTRVGTLPTGMGLVLWLSAVVVSEAAEDGYFEVMYNPFRTVRVARDQVKSMPSQQ